MQLSDKLSSISDDNIVVELETMLDQAHVSVNWYGQRLVSVEGYEGAVEINKLAEKYLRADAFDDGAGLQERLDCYALWGRVQKLYKKSDKVLKQTYLYQYLTPIREFRPYCRACAGDPMALIGEWDFSSRKTSLFEFSPEEFKKIWPNQEPDGKSWKFYYGRETMTEVWTATEKMVRAAVADQIEA
jgi:hypothetical protein